MPEPNYYEPPTSQLETPGRAPSPEEIASTGQRLSNFLLDWIGYFGFAMLLGVVLAVSKRSTRPSSEP